MDSNENDNKKEEPKKKSCCGQKREDLTRRKFIEGAAVIAGVAGAGMLVPELVQDAEGKAAVTTPTITCSQNATDANVLNVTVCAPAGGTGLPAGFTIQWMTCDDFTAVGGWAGAANAASFCDASFSGNASGSTYNLAQGTCKTVYVGSFELNNPQGYSSSCPDPLKCNTCYVFRAFGHANSTYNRSAFTTSNPYCTTPACPPTGFVGCTKSQGFYGGGGGPGTALLGCYFSSLTIGGFGGYTNTWSLIGDTQTLTKFKGTPTFAPGSNGIDDGLEALISAIGGGGGGAPLSANGTNLLQVNGLASQTMALTLNIGLSGHTCATTDCGAFPAGFGSAVICGVVDGSTPLAGTDTFPTGSAAAVNGKTVQQVLDAANTYLGNGGTVPFNLGSAGNLQALVALLNLSFDGTAAQPCCGASDFGLNHVCNP